MPTPVGPELELLLDPVKRVVELTEDVWMSLEDNVSEPVAPQASQGPVSNGEIPIADLLDRLHKMLVKLEE